MIPQRVVPFLVALAAFSLAPAAHAQTPRSDVTFGGGGVMTLPWAISNLDREVAAVAPDGGIFIVHESNQDLRVARLDVHGTPVATYVGGGIGRVSITEPFYLSAVHVEPDGSLLLGGRRDVIRIDATGRIDLTFGVAGRIRIPYLTNGICAAARVFKILPHAGGWLVFGRERYTDSSVAPPAERSCSYIARIGRDGTPDLDFGVNGNLPRPNFVAFDAMVREQYIELVGRLTGQSARVERVRLDGTMLESFGAFGTLELPGQAQTRFIADGRILADGSLVVLDSPDLTNLVLYRYRPDYTPDPQFTGIGRTVVPMRDQDRTQFDIWQARVLPVADGGFIVRVNVYAASSAVWVSDFYKVDSRGLADRSFGDSGYARLRAGGNSRVVAWAAQPDGYLVLTGVSFAALPTTSGMPPEPTFVTVTAFATRIQAVPDIVEFFNTITRHYFISYDGPEAQGIDSGAAGNGWVRTGLGLRPGGPDPECRFYTAGANSHFFTTEPAECEEVKHSPGWIYEGLGFYATRISNGGCASPLVPVYRFYNNRASFNDSNHRFVTDLAVRPAMEAQGWALEGVVFCAKP